MEIKKMNMILVIFGFFSFAALSQQVEIQEIELPKELRVEKIFASATNANISILLVATTKSQVGFLEIKENTTNFSSEGLRVWTEVNFFEPKLPIHETLVLADGRHGEMVVEKGPWGQSVIWFTTIGRKGIFPIEPIIGSLWRWDLSTPEPERVFFLNGVIPGLGYYLASIGGLALYNNRVFIRVSLYGVPGVYTGEVNKFGSIWGLGAEDPFLREPKSLVPNFFTLEGKLLRLHY